jgi:hypothetical protein
MIGAKIKLKGNLNRKEEIKEETREEGWKREGDINILHRRWVWLK